MTQVADLVARVFEAELDHRGRSALREMRLVGWFSPVLGGMLSMALFSEMISGQVWEENGRVVGNVTLQSADQSGVRWRISNVAVAPEWRGRGIARALMQAALAEIAGRGGNWAILQVRADNQAAYRLYRDLRFEDVARSTAWRLADPTPVIAPPLREAGLAPFRGVSGAEWLALARAARSHLSQWAEPISHAEYQWGVERMLGEALGRVTGLYEVSRWGARRAGRLMAVVEACAQPMSGVNTLRLTVHPEARGEFEAPLVAQGLAALARPSAAHPVFVEHDGEHGEALAALRQAGFQLQRDLITMRRPITSTDERAYVGRAR